MHMGHPVRPRRPPLQSQSPTRAAEPAAADAAERTHTPADSD